MVDALNLWKEIAKWSIPAVEFYGAEARRLYPTEYNKREDFEKKRERFEEDILCLGKANFDVLATKNSDEREDYRIAYYASRRGSMDMHIKQNLTTLKKFLQDLRESEKSILFVDYGCGPMTSGLALADVLSCSCGITDYKKRIRYHGIDRSKQVVKYAKRINSEYNVFDSERFSVVHAEEFCPSNIPPPPASAQIAILCLSFVLAPGTFKMAKQDAEQLAEEWDSFVRRLSGCEETRVIYINPTPGKQDPQRPPGWEPHKNWDLFRETLEKLELSNHEQGMVYCGGGTELCEWEKPHTCHMAMIEGRRRRQ